MQSKKFFPIGFDVRMATYSGIGTTIDGFLSNLSDERLERMCLIRSRNWTGSYHVESLESKYPVYSITQHFYLGKWLNSLNLGLYHMPHFDVPLGYRGKLVITIHDLIHLLFPQYSSYPLANLYAKVVMRNAVERADQIIVVSNNTKHDLCYFFPEVAHKIAVVYPAVAPDFFPLDKQDGHDVLERLKIPREFFLYVGNLRKSKNTPFLINTYLNLKKKIRDLPPLVLVGKNFLKEYELGMPDGIIYLGQLTKDELIALYSTCMGFIFPSLYEGFGLPPLEAMACGAPVITSNVSSIPEVCQDAAIYIDPKSPESLEKAIQSFLDSEELRKNLRSKGFLNVKRFSWQTFTDKTWNIYKDVLGEKL
ncbi:MAG: glycosyltransferase family 4 protein [Elusimicrobiota bacterium]